MTQFKKTSKVNDIEKPISSNLLGRDILGINPNVAAINKTGLDIEVEALSNDFMRKIK